VRKKVGVVEHLFETGLVVLLPFVDLIALDTSVFCVSKVMLEPHFCVLLQGRH